jgi:hypothetical protein
MPAKFDRCVRKVRRHSGWRVNPYAVCNTSLRRGRALRKRYGRSHGPFQVISSDGRVLNTSRNLAGIRKYVSKDPITHITLVHRGSEGTLQLKLYSGATYEAPFASFEVMRDFVDRWRNARGVPVEVR